MGRGQVNTFLVKPIGNLLMYWLRVPFSSSTGAAKAHVMKKAMMPEQKTDAVENRCCRSDQEASIEFENTAIYNLYA